MTATHRMLCIACAALLGGCTPESAGPDARLTPLLANAGTERHTIVVNPDANGNGVAATIQEGIDRVSAGGKVLVKAGVYDEVLVIDKGLTLEAIGDGNDPVVIAPSGTAAAVIDVLTREPVAIYDVTIAQTGANGIRGTGAVDLTVERVTIQADPPPGGSNLIAVFHEIADGSRARLVVRYSVIDAGVADDHPLPLPQAFGLRPQGDVDALFEANVIRRAGGACIFAVTRADLGGALNVEIVNNDIDQCHPAGRVASILIGPVATNLPSPTRPVTATGVVNIVGNRIQNTSESCRPASAIAFEVGSGRIEHNQISVVEACAIPTGRNLQGAVWVGRRQHPLFPAVSVSVRFNDLVGNAFAGLRVGQNQSLVIDAACNYWGSSDGPSGAGPGSGDAVVVEAGAAAPAFAPFARAPIAGTGATSLRLAGR